MQCMTSPALLWTGKVGDASAFQVWGSRAFVRDLSADKLSPRAAPCGPAPSGVSQVDAVEPVETTGDSGAAAGAEPGGAGTGSAEPGGAEPGGAEPGGAEPGGHEVSDESCVPVVPEQQMHVLTSSCSDERFQPDVHPLGRIEDTSVSGPQPCCEAEIYAGAMAAQELRWLTYLQTDLGEQPRSPPVLYVDNKAMLALCREQRLEHRTKHIALRYFLACEL
ncbi:unnamed protein product [Closterium sp. NIES-54]